MSLSAKPYLQKILLRSDSELDFDTYPLNIPAARDIEQIRFHPDVTFFVGENGSGKSTVLEALAVALSYSTEGGTKGVQLRTTEASAVSPLHAVLRLVQSFRKPKDGYFLRAESFFNVATYMDEVAPQYRHTYGVGSLHGCSHGESFMALLLNKLRGDGLYLFDELEAALSPSRQLAALSVIHQLVQASSQFIIATHSPILLSYPSARILRFDEDGITEVHYEETEHFNVTRDFLNNYPRRLERLLADDSDEN